MVLTNAKRIQAHAIRELDFLQDVRHALHRAGRALMLVLRVNGYKTVDSDLHGE